MKHENTGFRTKKWFAPAFPILAFLLVGFPICGQVAWGDNAPAEPTWGCVKCCFADPPKSCCCPRDGKETGKVGNGKGCVYIPVTADDLPVSGYLASRDCLLSVGPWSLEGIRECQGAVLWIELRSEEDLLDFEYSYVLCDGGEPYLVPMPKERSSGEQVSWGRIKTMYR
jgi:hypothetical protein